MKLFWPRLLLTLTVVLTAAAAMPVPERPVLKAGKRVAIPRYSHVTYDVDPDAREIVDTTDIVVIDGLHLAGVRDGANGRLIDQLIYLDADEADIERWFRARLIPLMQAGRTDPGSFYYLFREMDDAGQLAFAFLFDFSRQAILGGGPFESLIRILTHDNQMSDLTPTAGVVLAKTLDSLVMPVMSMLVYLVPNFQALDVTNMVADGFMVNWRTMLINTLLALAYVLPFSFAGFLILKNREVAA